MSDQELRDLVAALARETWEMRQAHHEALRESEQAHERERKQAERQIQKQIKQLGEQIGGLGNKFGYFTEGMAFPAMEKLLRNRFKMETIGLRVKSIVAGENLEVDVLAYTNGERNEAFIVEVKSLLRERELEQVLSLLQKFPHAFPEHANKRLYAIVAGVDVSKHMQERVLEEGLYLALIHDQQFRLTVPRNFKPGSAPIYRASKNYPFLVTGSEAL